MAPSGAGGRVQLPQLAWMDGMGDGLPRPPTSQSQRQRQHRLRQQSLLSPTPTRIADAGHREGRLISPGGGRPCAHFPSTVCSARTGRGRSKRNFQSPNGQASRPVVHPIYALACLPIAWLSRPPPCPTPVSTAGAPGGRAEMRRANRSFPALPRHMGQLISISVRPAPCRVRSDVLLSPYLGRR